MTIIPVSNEVDIMHHQVYFFNTSHVIASLFLTAVLVISRCIIVRFISWSFKIYIFVQISCSLTRTKLRMIEMQTVDAESEDDEDAELWKMGTCPLATLKPKKYMESPRQ